MKRYEYFNDMFERNETVEEHAIGMLVATILEEQGTTIRDNDYYVSLFKNYIKWLNEEVEE